MKSPVWCSAATTAAAPARSCTPSTSALAARSCALNPVPACSREVVRLSWKAPAPDLAFLVRFSADDGRTWRAVAPPTRARRLAVRTAGLTSGTACRFQVLATSGVRTGATVSAPFVLAARPRTAVITPPAQSSLPPGAAVVLQAEAFSPDSGSAPASEIAWSSDLDDALGAGRDIRFSSLTRGTHTVTARLTDGCGGETSVSIPITIAPRARAAEAQVHRHDSSH